jgi:hypothetical protein
MLRVKPSRSLNHNRGLFGLEGPDFAAAFALFVGWSVVFDATPYAVAAIPVAASALVCLSPLRLNHRRGAIRDWLSHRFTSRTLRIR